MKPITEAIVKVNSKVACSLAFKNMARVQREQALSILIHSPKQLIWNIFVKQDNWNPIIGEFDEEIFGDINNADFFYLTMGLMIYLHEVMESNNKSRTPYLKISKNTLFKIVEESFGVDSLILTYYNKFNQASGGLSQQSFNWSKFYINELLEKFSSSGKEINPSISHQISTPLFTRKLSTFGDEFLLTLENKLKQHHSSNNWRKAKLAVVASVGIFLLYSLSLDYEVSQVTSVYNNSEVGEEKVSPENQNLNTKDKKIENHRKPKEPSLQLQNGLLDVPSEKYIDENQSMPILEQLDELATMELGTPLENGLSNKTDYEHDISGNDQPIDNLIENATRLIDSGGYLSAIESLKEVVAKDKNHPEANYYIGLSHMKMRQFKIAKVYFLTVIRNKVSSDSFISKSFTQIAKTYIEENLTNLSFFTLGEALSFDPNNMEAQALRDKIVADRTANDSFLMDLK